MMIEAKDEQGGIDDQQIIDECLTFLFAGHETTSSLLSWAMYFIGKHPGTRTFQRLFDI